MNQAIRERALKSEGKTDTKIKEKVHSYMAALGSAGAPDGCSVARQDKRDLKDGGSPGGGGEGSLTWFWLAVKNELETRW